jgi:hypothetical protein
MRYTAPQITNSWRASDAIQSIGLPLTEKHLGIFPDNTEPYCTPLAYEADE